MTKTLEKVRGVVGFFVWLVSLVTQSKFLRYGFTLKVNIVRPIFFRLTHAMVFSFGIVFFSQKTGRMNTNASDIAKIQVRDNLEHYGAEIKPMRVRAALYFVVYGHFDSQEDLDKLGGASERPFTTEDFVSCFPDHVLFMLAEAGYAIVFWISFSFPKHH